MEPHAPNLLSALFSWRPRDKTTPAENFLTEAFVHTLRLNSVFRTEWLSTTLGASVDPTSVDISTRASFKNDLTNTSIYPDIRIRGELTSGSPFAVLIEVKWDAPYSFDQLSKYDRLLQLEPNGHLIFICARLSDWRIAQRNADQIENARFHAVKWEDVFAKLQGASDICPFTQELVGFMRYQGLNPGEPITTEMTTAYIAAKPFHNRLQRYANKLMREFDWAFMPELYRDPPTLEVRARFGRLALEFIPSLNVALTVGFLYDNADHRVPFADGSNNSIDFFVRIEAHPSIVGRAEVNHAINKNLNALQAAGGVVRYEGDGVNRNSHTLIIMQRSFIDFLLGNEDEQLEQMHDQAKKWLSALFADGVVAGALLKLKKAES